MEEQTNLVVSHLHALAFFAAATAATGAVAWRKGLFRLTETKKAVGPPIALGDVVGAYLLYFLVQMVLVPFLVLTAAYLAKVWGGASFVGLEGSARVWFFVGATAISSVAVVGYLFSLRRERRDLIMGGKRSFKAYRRDVMAGVGGWFVCYPFVMAAAHLVSLAVILFVSPAEEEQLAVRYLKSAAGHPLLLWSSIVVTVTVIPFTEELLFRGFLQTYLRQKIGAMKAITVSSLIFGLFHFSAIQGASNIPFIISLMLLSGFLGFLYERQRSLLSPVILHMLFNMAGISVMFLKDTP